MKRLEPEDLTEADLDAFTVKKWPAVPAEENLPHLKWSPKCGHFIPDDKLEVVLGTLFGLLIAGLMVGVYFSEYAR